LHEELRRQHGQKIVRKDFEGIQEEGGINTFATTALIQGGLSHPAVKHLLPSSQCQLAAIAGGPLSKYSLGVLEGILAGAANARHQLEKMNLVEKPWQVYGPHLGALLVSSS